METKCNKKPSSAGGFSMLTRRGLFGTIPALLLAPAALAQNPAPIPVRKLHSCTIRVSDVARSMRFYQDVFGAAIQARQGRTICLRIGEGPQFFALSPLQEGEQPGFAHIGLSVDDFEPLAVQESLEAHGVVPAEPPAQGQPALEMAMRSWQIQRRQARGGAYEGTAELYFADAEGVIYHLTSEDYCGGSGPLGESCPNIESARQDGFFELVDLSHFTSFMANQDRANDFITAAFGKSFQAYQGPGSPVIGVGDGVQFLMYVGGEQPGRPDNPGRIDHVSLSVRDFDVDSILQRLTEYGLAPRQDASNTQPLMHWISMRMPNRGGAEGGTPELYFSDPDGIRIQLQDPGYCGGSGYLGDSCPELA